MKRIAAALVAPVSRAIIGTLVLCTLLSGCATSPLTGRSQLLIVSHERAMSSSAAAYNGMLADLDKKGKIERDTPRVGRVREITERLIAEAVRFRPDSATWNWQLTVIDEPKVVNAFCMAGGKMGIYTGFWEKLGASDDEIAHVMGHEIAHALADHTRERMSIAMTTSVAAAVLAVATSSRDSSDSFARNHDAFALAAALAITLPNSRTGETEADQIGMELAARAGFDPGAAVTLWEKMSRLGGSPPEFLSTHPSPENRAQNLRQMIAKVEKYYHEARARPAVKAPSFLSAGVNEQVVGGESRQEYAARVAAEGQTLSFLTEPLEKFRRGEAVLDCGARCFVGYTLERGKWKEMYERQNWRDLALSIMKVGYGNDLAYFLLAEAARAMNAEAAARHYYRRAVEAAEAGNSCTRLFDSCLEFDVRARATAALR